ncbi:hypothetical protein CRX72_26760 [Pantoea sp. BRM17]|nr:hypothetical protein CRX72_26760 [Pantoea sp. BRM17]
MEIKFSRVKRLSSCFCGAKVERSQKAWRGYEFLFHPESFCYLPDISCDRLHSPEICAIDIQILIIEKLHQRLCRCQSDRAHISFPLLAGIR